MIPNAVRVACPQCTFSVVVTAEIATDEFRLPEGVRRRVQGEFYCNNCDLPMKAVASVETRTERTIVPSPDTMTEAERLEKILVAQQDVDDAFDDYEAAKNKASTLKKVWENRVETLGVVIKRLAGVPQPGEALPILDLAEQDQPAACNATDPDDVWVCSLPAGHDGDHHDQGAAGKDGAPATWPQTAVEQAAAMQDGASNEDEKQEAEPSRILPHRRKRQAPAGVEQPEIANA